ncbi:MAG: stage V sporulation protein AD [Firmicutes bacterium]|nr:stage V sporulation protein AD [Bacillota bacterium]
MILHKGENCRFVIKEPDIELMSPKTKKTIRHTNDIKGQVTTLFNPVSILSKSSVASSKEANGPIGKYLSNVLEDDKCGEKTFEKAELKMLTMAVLDALNDANLSAKDIDLLLAGDLLNQITSSSYLARELKIPYLGLYSACSTMTQSLALGACLIDSGHFNTVACATASHFATAERQYRYPLEYGNQRPPYAQWTVTGAGCTILTSDSMIQNDSKQKMQKITHTIIGKAIDYGINDINNMGAAMAPAAVDSMMAFFNEKNASVNDFDLIVTGDLGKLGSDIVRDLMRERGHELGQKYVDCGNLIYDVNQRCYQGGSGAGCSAVALNSFILDKMAKGEYNRVAVFATGALMNPTMCNQGESIPCISHGVIIENL